jgi:hypothetical protein
MLNEKKFRAIYDDYLVSGLTIRDFCANIQLNEAKFFYWQHKLKGQLPSKLGFVPMVFENGQPAPRPFTPQRKRTDSFTDMSGKQVSCEITFPNGICVKLNGVSDPELLRSLLVLTRQ